VLAPAARLPRPGAAPQPQAADTPSQQPPPEPHTPSLHPLPARSPGRHPARAPLTWATASPRRSVPRTAAVRTLPHAPSFRSPRAWAQPSRPCALSPCGCRSLLGSRRAAPLPPACLHLSTPRIRLRQPPGPACSRAPSQRRCRPPPATPARAPRPAASSSRRLPVPLRAAAACTAWRRRKGERGKEAGERKGKRPVIKRKALG
jgi:hypothetical protein